MCLFIQIFSICMLLNIYTHTQVQNYDIYIQKKKRELNIITYQL